MHVRFLSHRNLSTLGTKRVCGARARLGAAVATVVIAAAPSVVCADDWKNNASGSWHDPNSWVDGTVPTASDFAFFTNLVTGTVSFTGDAVSNGVTLRNPTGVITFDVGAGNKWTQGIFTLLGEGNYLQSPAMVLSSGEIDTNLVLIGNNPFVDGHVTVTGSTSILTATRGSVRVGSDDGSNSTLLVSNGGTVRTSAGFLGLQNAVNCTITVTDPGSSFTVSNGFQIGSSIDDDVNGGGHHLDIVNAGQVSSGQLLVGVGGTFADAPNNTVKVSGANSKLTLTARTSSTSISTLALAVGFNDSGHTLLIENGGEVVANVSDVRLGSNVDSHNNLLQITNGTFTMNGTGALATAGSGRFDVRRGKFWIESGTATLPGLLANTGAESVLQLDGGTVIVANASVANSAPLLVGDGAGATMTYRLSDPAGTHTFTDGMVIQSDGRLEGAATIVGNVTNNNIIQMAPNAGTMNIVGTITINEPAGAKYDLSNNKLITNTAAGTATAGVYNGLQGDVQAASNFGAWNGPGLTTTQADAVAGLTTIGVATGEQIRGLGATDTDTFAGQTITGASTIAMYTYAGDANLDGTIDGGDYGIIDNFAQVPGADGYANGDFNYDGVIDGGDYGIIDNNNQAQGAPFPTSGNSAAGLSGVNAVPEPASLAVVAAGLLGNCMRRRRTRRRSS